MAAKLFVGASESWFINLGLPHLISVPPSPLVKHSACYKSQSLPFAEGQNVRLRDIKGHDQTAVVGYKGSLRTRPPDSAVQSRLSTVTPATTK